jgi:hypothetical protein
MLTVRIAVNIGGHGDSIASLQHYYPVRYFKAIRTISHVSYSSCVMAG